MTKARKAGSGASKDKDEALGEAKDQREPVTQRDPSGQMVEAQTADGAKAKSSTAIKATAKGRAAAKGHAARGPGGPGSQEGAVVSVRPARKSKLGKGAKSTGPSDFDRCLEFSRVVEALCGTPPEKWNDVQLSLFAEAFKAAAPALVFILHQTVVACRLYLSRTQVKAGEPPQLGACRAPEADDPQTTPEEKARAWLEEFDRQSFLIFCIIVANKTEQFARRVIYRLFTQVDKAEAVKRSVVSDLLDEARELPFVTIKGWVKRGVLTDKLKGSRCGQYKRVGRALEELVTTRIDLRTCTVEELESVYGIGPKTARFFLLRTRPGIEVAALDTHVLKWLRDNGHKAPKATPPSPVAYRRLEQIFIKEAKARGKTPAAFDLEVWEHYANKASIVPEGKVAVAES